MSKFQKVYKKKLFSEPSWRFLKTSLLMRHIEEQMEKGGDWCTTISYSFLSSSVSIAKCRIVQFAKYICKHFKYYCPNRWIQMVEKGWRKGVIDAQRSLILFLAAGSAGDTQRALQAQPRQTWWWSIDGELWNLTLDLQHSMRSVMARECLEQRRRGRH